jgi:hypothetical protein
MSLLSVYSSPSCFHSLILLVNHSFLILPLPKCFPFFLFQVVQHQPVKYEIFPLSPLSRHRLSKFLFSTS